MEMGNFIVPTEWFIAPLEVIKEAIQLIVCGDILKYPYDENDERIISRRN